jgi:hypothetical protein
MRLDDKIKGEGKVSTKDSRDAHIVRVLTKGRDG